MNKKMTQTLIQEGAVKKVHIVADGATFHIDIYTINGATTVTTDKGAIKTWVNLDSAARWIRELGIGKTQLEIARWQPGQKALKL